MVIPAAANTSPSIGSGCPRPSRAFATPVMGLSEVGALVVDVPLLVCFCVEDATFDSAHERFFFFACVKVHTIGDTSRHRQVQEGERQEVFSRIHELLQIGNLAAVHPVENLCEMIGAAMAIEYLPDLVGAELDVLEDGAVGSEGAEDAVVAEVGDALVVFGHGGHEIMGVGLVLVDG